MDDAQATCRWCHEPIAYMNEQWVHEGPQLGKYATHQRACEPDMQSMLAEPVDDNDTPQ